VKVNPTMVGLTLDQLVQKASTDGAKHNQISFALIKCCHELVDFGQSKLFPSLTMDLNFGFRQAATSSP